MATSCCRPPASPAGRGGRRTPRQVVADRRQAGAVAERPVAEALRAWAIDLDTAAGRQEPGDPPAEPADQEPDRQDRQRDREPEDGFGDSWRTYRERAEHIRQAYGWTVPKPPPRAENWLPLGRDDLEDYTPPARPRRRLDEERDSDREDR